MLENSSFCREKRLVWPQDSDSSVGTLLDIVIEKDLDRQLSTTPNPVLPLTPAPARRRCLAAVASHDARMDGAFVYAVRSTGIYCRPSCPSRRPCTGQILFFAKPEAAEQAGFRACRRCHLRQSR